MKKTTADKLKTLIFVISIGLVFSGFQPARANAPTDFKQANDLYRAGKFVEAAKLYEGLSAGAADSERVLLFYNAANSYYRAGQINQAIWSYERALFINPWFSDARYNLKSVRSKIEYKIEDHRNVFMHVHDLALKWFKTAHLALAALIFSLIFLISSAFWFRNPNREHFWAFPRGEVFAACLFFAVLCGANYLYSQIYAEAIVLAAEAEVRYGPSMDNQSLMKLGGGLKVFVVDAREDWSRVVTWNGETGWIKNSELGRVDA